MGNAQFLADSYFGHRTRLYNLDLLRNPNNVSKIIEKSYECGVRSINLANFGSVCEAFDIACENGVEMQVVSTLGKTDMNYVMPNYKQAREEATIDEDIEKLSQYDNAVMLIDEFLVDDYDWDFLMGILDKIKKVIINKILAVGIQRPQEAFEFLKTLDYADMVAIGIASEHEAEETFGILNKM